MRVLLSTYGSRGDVEPLVGLAVALQAMDAEVRVCGPPDEDFAQRLASVNTELFPVWLSAKALTLVSVTFQQLPLPSPHRRPLEYPGLPLPPEPIDNRLLWELDAQNINALFGEALNTNRAVLGLSAVDDVRDYVTGARPWLATDPVLDPWDPTLDLDVIQTGAWLVPDDRALPADLMAFLDAGPPPVYVGFGSMPMHASADIAEDAIEAIRAHGRRVVLAGGWANLALVDGRDDCFIVGEVNQQALFGRVAAVVHHGGAGTTTTAAFAGAPQVVVPQAADQPYWGDRVADLGIGTAADTIPTPTRESLSAALRMALTPETRARATAVATTFRTDGATVAAKLLLDTDS